jgi:ArsR family metal-binding transcriptional regulator
MNNTKQLIEEAKEKQRKIKQDILALLEKSNTPNMTKEKIRNELFNIYKEIK